MIKLFASLYFLTPFFVSAQTITIGSGTDLNSTTTSSPINIYYRRQVCQFVYTANEINAAGFNGAGDINVLGFFVEVAPIYEIPAYTIKMKHTAFSAASVAIDPAGLQTVKGPFDYLPASGDWDMLSLDTPFQWNGVDNILVEICWSQIIPNWNASGQCRVFNSTNGYRYTRDDATGSLCNGVTNQLLAIKPQIRLTFEESSIWTGIASNEWNNPLNWTSGVPNENVDALLTSTALNYPLITDSVVCRNLTNEGSLSMNSNGHLNLFGDFSQAGLFQHGEGKISFRGSNACALENSSDLVVNNLNIECAGGLTLSGIEIVLVGSLDISRSNLNTNDLLTLRSDINGTARIGELKSECSFSLNMLDSYGDGWNGGYLELFINGSLSETFSAAGYGSVSNFSLPKGSLFELYYFSGAWEAENTYELLDEDGLVLFSDGTNPNVGLAFGATANCEFVELISGDISMERYIDPGATWWRYIGSAVQEASLDQFNDDFTTSGYPGSLFPNFNFISAYSFDETLDNFNGYISPSAGTQILTPGEGWQVYCGDGLQGTNEFTFDLKGVPNQGPIALPVTYTSNTDGQDGWCLVANPYASTINWDATAWQKTNVSGAIYIQNPNTQQYTAYVNGASTNGGSPYIASQQSFWVRAIDNSPTLISDEAVKVRNDHPFVKTSALSPGMTIKFGNGSNFDEAVIRDLSHANDEFEYEVDAEKYWNNYPVEPQLSVINGEQKDLAVHSFNKGYDEWSIPLRTLVIDDGLHFLEFYNTQEIDVPCMFVEDTYTGESYLVSEGVSYGFMMSDTTFTPRFILHIGKNFLFQTQSLECLGDNTGEVLVNLDTAWVTYSLTHNGIDNVIGLAQGDPFVLTGLEGGLYYLEIFGANNICGQPLFDFVISEPSAAQVSATITPESFGNDGSIELNVVGGTAPFIFEWINGFVGDSIYNLTSGNYQVNIFDFNHCLTEANYEVTSVLGLSAQENDYEAFYNRDQNTIQLSGIEIPEEDRLFLLDMRGRRIEIEVDKMGESDYSVSLPNLRSGVYNLFSVGDIMFNYRFLVVSE
jgi:hypothetical protein